MQLTKTGKIFLYNLWASHLAGKVLHRKASREGVYSSSFFISTKVARAELGPSYKDIMTTYAQCIDRQYRQSGNEDGYQAETMCWVWKEGPIKELVSSITPEEIKEAKRAYWYRAVECNKKKAEGAQAAATDYYKVEAPLSLSRCKATLELLEKSSPIFEDLSAEKKWLAINLLKSVEPGEGDCGLWVDTYKRINGGRYYAVGVNLQNLPKVIFQRILAPGSTTIDIKNCFPTLILAEASSRGLELPSIKSYVENRDDQLSDLADYYKVAPAAAKILVLSVLFGAGLGSKGEAIKTWAEGASAIIPTDAAGEDSHHPIIKGIASDVKVASKGFDLGKGEASGYSLEIQRIESKILDCIIGYCNLTGRRAIVLSFDGLTFLGPQFSEATIKGLVATIKRRTGLDLNLGFSQKTY